MPCLRTAWLDRVGLILLVSFVAANCSWCADESWTKPTSNAEHATQILSQRSSNTPPPRVAGKAHPIVSDLQRRRRATFIENRGQFPEQVKFQLALSGRTVWLTKRGVVLDLPSDRTPPGDSGSTVNPLTHYAPQGAEPRDIQRLAVYEEFVGANSSPKIDAKSPRPGIYNYFTGGDPTNWHTDVKGYAEVVYRNVWDGIDVRLDGSGPDLEQEFVVAPGSDFSQVRIGYKGIDGLDVSADGSLRIRTTFGELRESQPRVYQEIGGKRVAVKARFRLTDEKTYTFAVDHYRAEYALVIDPTLLYSTYLGGNNVNVFNNQGSSPQYAAGIAVDSTGNAYVSGTAYSADFPTTPGAYSSSTAEPDNAFVTKFDPLGDDFVYSTYLTPASAANAIALDTSGDAYVTGEAGPTFPTTANALEMGCPAGGAFLTVLNPSGSGLIYSTCLGPETLGNGIAVDPSGIAYLTGFGGTVPTTPSAAQPTPGGSSDAFVTVINPAASGASSLVYSTYLGGSDTDIGNAITVDSFGDIYVTGTSNGSHFPVTPGAYQTTFFGTLCSGSAGFVPCTSAFVAKLNPNVSGPSGLIYATYLTGSYGSTGAGITVDHSGNAYVAGTTAIVMGVPPPIPFPSTPGAFLSCAAGSLGNSYVFVTKLNAAGSGLVYSTCLAGSGSFAAVGGQGGTGIALDASGNAYVTGYTASTIFPLTPNAFQTTLQRGGLDIDGFLTELNSTGSGLIYSTYLGGAGGDTSPSAIAVDAVGDAYITGWTSSLNFPITPFAHQPAIQGTQDAFITKFPLGAPGGLSLVGILPNTGGNSGTISPVIIGTGFHAGATVRLVGPSEISGSSINVGAEGRTITSSFNLIGATPGLYSVLVTNPDASMVVLPQGFTIQQGGAPHIWLTIFGGGAIRAGGSQVLTVAYGNNGSVDGTYLPLWITFPSFLGYSVETESPLSIPSIVNGNTLLTSDLFSIGAGSSGLFSFALTANAPEGVTFPITSWTDNNIPDIVPLPQTSALTNHWNGWREALDAIVHWVVDVSPYTVEEPAGVVFDIGTHLPGLGICGVIAAVALRQNALGITDLNNDVFPFDDPRYSALGNLLQQLQAAAGNAGLVCGTPPSGSPSLPTQVIDAVDPNSLIGTPGIGNSRWLSASQPLTYFLSFGNEASATAPAQAVVVTDGLGPNIDLSTLSLKAIIFNGSPIPLLGSAAPIIGFTSFTTNVDLRPAQKLLVNISVQLNSANGMLTATFTSIDPITGVPPNDPTIGFLPPGAQDSLLFSALPRQTLPTGTQASNAATIVFDQNGPLSTPTWVNTIDNTPPTSHVSALPATSSCPSFGVNWSGSDIGSGLQGFTIYASDNGGPFTPWLSNTTAASADYTGAVGHTYSFNSIATDLTGNVETGKTSGEASTSVTATGPCGPPSLSGQVSSVSQSGTTVTVSLQLTNKGFTPAQALNINKISVRTLSGSGTVMLTGPTLPAAEGPLGIGASTTVTLTFTIPNTVTRFSLTESGNLKDATGNTYDYSVAQTVIP
jgi:hypothetical protein